MTKKIVIGILTAALVACAFFSLVSCQEKDTKIVYLGDSIAEAVLGPSPLSERENYGYYAVNGKRNEYTYVNRSVSGHKTEHMLEYISREDENALMTKSHLQTADIIQVSILGNDMLQSDVTGLLIEYAQQKAGEIAVEDTDREHILVNSRVNFAAIIAKLKELNPNAIILMQTVYNPVYDGTPLIGQRARDLLPSYGYSDGGNGEKSFRGLGGELLASLNSVIYEYHDAHPDEFYIVDVFKAFDEIYAADPMRAARLIYPDGIHPSNEGHAVIADATQKVLEDLGLADGVKALKNYKSLRIEQLKRLFPKIDNQKKVIFDIKNASSNEEVTEIYFNAINGLTPVIA